MGNRIVKRKRIRSTDLPIIEELENLLGRELNLVDVLFWVISGFELNDQSEIIGINLFSYTKLECNRILSVLTKIPKLIKLILVSSEIADITNLSPLKELQELSLHRVHISNPTSLFELIKLNKLTLEDSNVTDLTLIPNLRKLSYLSVSESNITDITPICQLSGLKYLSIENSNITNITSISRLSNLKYLSFQNANITDSTPLSELKFLEYLSLQKTNITNIAPLSKLTNLRELDISDTPTSELTSLIPLKKLKTLNLYGTNVSDLSPLAKLISLTKLDIGKAKITDISSLSKLKALENLVIVRTNITHFNAQLLRSLPKLKNLTLFGNPILNIPKAIFELDNCLPDLKNYFKDNARRKTQVYETKLILIGNGRVGKTSLLSRWLDNKFNPNEHSTHAIQLRPWLLDKLAKQAKLEKLRLNIWDFGGQDIYHATHRTFMRTEAIFLLVWDAQTETMQEQEEILPDGKTIKYKNYPIEYWLSYIKVLSNDSPVIVVQTHRNRDKQKLNILTEAHQKEYNVKAILAVESSSVTANGYEALKEQIQELIVEQLRETCTSMPTSWYHIRTQIANLHEEQQIKQISLAQFKAICRNEQLDGSSIQTLLTYFHNTGVFFYQKGLFNNQIVIDQKWAIDAVYALFDRKSYFARLHQNGRFTQKDLQEYWQQYTQEEQELFLSFMIQCEICFKVRNPNNYATTLKEKEFIAPQLLPESTPLSVKALHWQCNGVYYKYRHRVLHSAIIQRFIVRTGNMANENEMWQIGIVLNTEEGMALTEAFPEQNEIVIRLNNIKQKPLLDKIRNEMKEINADEADIEEFVSLDGINFINLRSLKSNPLGNECIQAENGNWISADALRIFLVLSEEEIFKKPGKLKKQTKKARKAIPQKAKVRALLQKEIDSMCPFCTSEEVGVFDIHHIDEDRDNHIMGNLLLVCPTCHSKITKGDIEKKKVLKKKKQLSSL